MTDPNRSHQAAPVDPRLAALVHDVQSAVSQADPLTGALLGGPLALPNPDQTAEMAALARLEQLATAVGQLGVRAAGEDELDRLCLLYGLRRAVVAARPGDPSGPVTLERHLQLRLLRLLEQPARGLEDLAELVEAGPSLLRAARRDPAAGSVQAGRVALDSTRRMPALLDACAGAVSDAGLATRTGVEAALGSLLQASAEESGWLLKEYLPAARALATAAPLDTLSAGLGMSPAQLEDGAEGLMAEAVGDLADRAGPDDLSNDSELAGADDVARVWEAAGQDASQRFGPTPGMSAVLTEVPAWLAPLLPPISLWQPGPLGGAPLRLLVGSPRRAELAYLAREVYEADFMPAAFQREGVRPARLLLPLPELQQGWRAHVRAGGAGPSNWSTELAWRAALALAALAMARGQATVEDAAGLIAAEAGLPADQALLQAMTVAQQPLAALSFVAGTAAVRRALASVPPAQLLAGGPLPGLAIAG